jgi:hypothetical protein
VAFQQSLPPPPHPRSIRLIFTRSAGWKFWAGEMTNHVAAYIRKGANSKHKELSNKKPQFLLQRPKKTLVFVAKTIQKYDARHNEDGFVVFQRYLRTLAQNNCKYDQFAE